MTADPSKVARWFAFNPKIRIWVNFGRSWNGICLYILWTLGPFYGLLLYFMDVWYSSWLFGIFFLVLVFCAKKNVATPDPCGVHFRNQFRPDYVRPNFPAGIFGLNFKKIPSFFQKYLPEIYFFIL
jgi:hypothetical protein